MVEFNEVVFTQHKRSLSSHLPTAIKLTFELNFLTFLKAGCVIYNPFTNKSILNG